MIAEVTINKKIQENYEKALLKLSNEIDDIMNSSLIDDIKIDILTSKSKLTEGSIAKTCVFKKYLEDGNNIIKMVIITVNYDKKFNLYSFDINSLNSLWYPVHLYSELSTGSFKKVKIYIRKIAESTIKLLK